MVGDGGGRGDLLGAGRERALGEVGVLSRRHDEALVEATESLEQVARVGDVARLAPRRRRVDVLRARVRRAADEVGLVGIRAGRPLHDRAGMRLGGGKNPLQPALRRPAVVVGEHHEWRARRAPRRVALGGRPGARGEAQVAQRAVRRERVGAQQLLGVLAAVVPDDHLPQLAVEGLLLQRVEHPAQPDRSAVRRNHHAHAQLGHNSGVR